MKHINDPPPGVLERRPDSPAPRLAIGRATAKSPADRLRLDGRRSSRELQACVDELGGKAGTRGR